MSDSAGHIAAARAVLAIEQQAIGEASAQLGPSFAAAADALLAATGKAVLTGVGKSGLVARKVASTLASTGTPALFMHPSDALHGDLGVIARGDCIVAFSHSGTADEIAAVLEHGRALGTPLIVFTGNASAPLAAAADIVIPVAVSREACPLNLAPTASAIATLALGDALAMALLEARGFTPEDFARTHPRGALGRRLLLRVSDVMRTGSELPLVAPDAKVADALIEMTAKKLGMAMATGPDGALAGIFTDGDLRRCLERGTDVHAAAMSEVMTQDPHTIGPERLAAEAAELMRSASINQLPVVAEGRIAGAITIQLLLAQQVA